MATKKFSRASLYDFRTKSELKTMLKSTITRQKQLSNMTDDAFHKKYELSTPRKHAIRNASSFENQLRKQIAIKDRLKRKR